jgi:hypothetical protein
MAYLPKGRAPRPNYTPQLPRTSGRLTSRGTLSRPKAMPKPSLSRDVPPLRYVSRG